MSRKLFDSHCHIIDHRFPIVANHGYTRVLGPELAQKTFWDNPVALYRRKP